VGLKENVLIGKLIPAGSGMMAYRDYQLGKTPAARVPAQAPVVENNSIVQEMDDEDVEIIEDTEE
jgi:hypothetical protein